MRTVLETIEEDFAFVGGAEAAADTVLILDKSARLEDVATLTCTGRDIQ